MDVRLTSVGVDRVRKNARDLCASRKQLGSTAAARLLNIIVRRLVAAINGHGTLASDEVDLSEIMKIKRRLGP